MLELLKNRQRTLVGGHRGCNCSFKENTIKALEEGKSRGADYFEIDIQLSKDDIPVVYHDIRLEERGTLTGFIRDFTAFELKQKMGVETLEEMLIWGRENNTYFALELKSMPFYTWETDFRLVELLPNLLNTCRMKENVYAFGTNYAALKRLKINDPSFNIGLIVPFVPVDAVELLEQMNAMVYLSYLTNLTPTIIADVQNAGFFVSASVLNDSESIKLAKSYGVAMYESDYLKI